VARESFKVKLPDGSELDAYKGGIEDQLVSFLNDTRSKPGKIYGSILMMSISLLSQQNNS
jgi:hypothetical protein